MEKAKKISIPHNYTITPSEIIKRINASDEALRQISDFRLNKKKLAEILSGISVPVPPNEERDILNYISLWKKSKKLLKIYTAALKATISEIDPLIDSTLDNNFNGQYKVDLDTKVFVRQLKKIIDFLRAFKNDTQKYRPIYLHSLLLQKEEYPRKRKYESVNKVVKVLTWLAAYLQSKRIIKKEDIANISEVFVTLALPEGGGEIYADNIKKILERHEVYINLEANKIFEKMCEEYTPSTAAKHQSGVIKSP